MYSHPFPGNWQSITQRVPVSFPKGTHTPGKKQYSPHPLLYLQHSLVST